MVLSPLETVENPERERGEERKRAHIRQLSGVTTLVTVTELRGPESQKGKREQGRTARSWKNKADKTCRNLRKTCGVSGS